MPSTNITSSFHIATDNFRSATELAGKFEQPEAAGAALRLHRSCRPGLPISFDVSRTIRYEDSLAGKLQSLWHRVTDNVWGSSRHAVRSDLHSQARIQDWLVRELQADGPVDVPIDAPIDAPVDQRADEDPGKAQASDIKGKGKEQPQVSRRATGDHAAADTKSPRVNNSVSTGILRELWPDIPLSSDTRPTAASLQNLTIVSDTAKDSFNAWLKFTDHSGPFHRQNVDRKQTRIEGNRLTLVYQYEGTPLQFTFTADPGSDRAMRDLRRLHRVATGKEAGYQNLGELVSSFLVATVEDEVADKLRDYVYRTFVDETLTRRAGTGVKPEPRADRFLLAQPNGRLTGTAQRAVEAAVEKCRSDCIVQARYMATRWTQLAQGDRGSAGRARIAVAFRAIAASVPEHDKERPPVDDFVGDVLTEFSWNRKHAPVSPGNGALVIEYCRKPRWADRIACFFRGHDAPEPTRRVVAVRWDTPAAVFVPNNRFRAAELASSARIGDKLPDNLAALARAIYAKPLHRAWLDAQRTFRDNKLKELGGDDPDTLRQLMGPLRVGRCTFADVEMSTGVLESGPVEDRAVHVRLATLDGRAMEFASDEQAASAAVYSLLTGKDHVQRGVGARPRPDVFAFWRKWQVTFSPPPVGQAGPSGQKPESVQPQPPEPPTQPQQPEQRLEKRLDSPQPRKDKEKGKDKKEVKVKDKEKSKDKEKVSDSVAPEPERVPSEEEPPVASSSGSSSSASASSSSSASASVSSSSNGSSRPEPGAEPSPEPGPQPSPETSPEPKQDATAMPV